MGGLPVVYGVQLRGSVGRGDPRPHLSAGRRQRRLHRTAHSGQSELPDRQPVSRGRVARQGVSTRGVPSKRPAARTWRPGLEAHRLRSRFSLVAVVQGQAWPVGPRCTIELRSTWTRYSPTSSLASLPQMLRSIYPVHLNGRLAWVFTGQSDADTPIDLSGAGGVL
jgi:hypothetical protein